MKKVFFLTIFSLLFVFASQVKAAETMVFDSTNNYLGACLLTDKSEWELTRDYNVTKFEVWYNWDQGETSLPVTIYQDGKEFAKFEATRASCDPYQKQWCNADYPIDKLFPKGKYSTVIPSKKQCLKPGGTGAIRLYEDVILSPTTTEKSTPTETPTNSPAVTPTITAIAGNKQITPEPSCSCTKTIVTTAIATSFISSLLSFLIFKKLK